MSKPRYAVYIALKGERKLVVVESTVQPQVSIYLLDEDSDCYKEFEPNVLHGETEIANFEDKEDEDRGGIIV